jgi:hypothetical protein
MRRAAVTCRSRHGGMRMDIEQVFAAQVFGAESQATVSQQQGHRERRVPRRREYAADSISCSPATFRDNERMSAMSMAWMDSRGAGHRLSCEP